MQALEQRQLAEAALTQAREALEGSNSRLQTMETGRLKTERALEPLKERAQAMELKLAGGALAGKPLRGRTCRGRSGGLAG
jgi:hypothetical protein